MEKVKRYYKDGHCANCGQYRKVAYWDTGQGWNGKEMVSVPLHLCRHCRAWMTRWKNRRKQQCPKSQMVG